MKFKEEMILTDVLQFKRLQKKKPEKRDEIWTRERADKNKPSLQQVA